VSLEVKTKSGPLTGLRVLEFAGLGPGPFACMLLADMGADVVTIDRPQAAPPQATQIMRRGRSVVHIDLKDRAGLESILEMSDAADVLIEGYRPGVMERLSLGPEVLCQRNPRLIYGRMTGWGQTGPLAHTAGHDINYIAMSGALHGIGPAGGAPVPPLNLIGDYGGGSLYLVMGILAALHERSRSGLGQVVDAAITDGVLSLMTQFVAAGTRGDHSALRGTNLLDGGAPHYAVYETADQHHVVVGALEPQFFALLCERLGVNPQLRDARTDRTRWPELRAEFERIFRTRTRAQWQEALQDSDACLAPVLSWQEAMAHPQIKARASFIELDGVAQPAPAPRFSRTPSRVQHGPARGGKEMQDVLKQWRSS
jgi:alpha-methylacyl-CoA racemase